MTTLAMHPESERLEFLKWVSERNAHIPMSLLEFLIDIPADHSDDNAASVDGAWH
jgi:hypothetical protein